MRAPLSSNHFASQIHPHCGSDNSCLRQNGAGYANFHSEAATKPVATALHLQITVCQQNQKQNFKAFSDLTSIRCFLSARMFLFLQVVFDKAMLDANTNRTIQTHILFM
jgi:hypothetical protein